jgi:hypothetical protein
VEEESSAPLMARMKPVDMFYHTLQQYLRAAGLPQQLHRAKWPAAVLQQVRESVILTHAHGAAVGYSVANARVPCAAMCSNVWRDITHSGGHCRPVTCAFLFFRTRAQRKIHLQRQLQ